MSPNIRRRSSDPRLDEIEAQVAKIAGQLTEHTKGFAERSARLERMEVELNDINKTTKKLTDAVFGNGKVGLVTDMHEVLQILDAVKKVGWLLVTILTTSILGAILAHIINPRLP